MHIHQLDTCYKTYWLKFLFGDTYRYMGKKIIFTKKKVIGHINVTIWYFTWPGLLKETHRHVSRPPNLSRALSKGHRCLVWYVFMFCSQKFYDFC